MRGGNYPAVAALAIALPLLAGCTEDATGTPDGPAGVGGKPAATTKADVCAVLPAADVEQVFAVTGVTATKAKDMDVFDSRTYSCDYAKGFEFTLNVGLTVARAGTGSPEVTLQAASVGSSGEKISGLGDAAVFRTPQAGVSQLMAIERSGGEDRVVTVTGADGTKDRYVTLAKKLLDAV